MTNKNKETSYSTIFLTAVLCAMLGIVIGAYFSDSLMGKETTTVVVEEPKAQIFTEFKMWGENTDQKNEYIITYWVDNFGETESKNTIVECVIEDTNGNLIKKVEKNEGNLASGSTTYGEMYTYLYSNTIDDTAFCYTKSCTNCEILEKNIIDYEKYYEN